jgi:glycosyltransferase involved in cell wall biosynthesis
MPSRTIVFGMNTMFAVRQFLPDCLAMVQRSGFHVVVIAPEGEKPDFGAGVEFRHICIRREISPLADLRALIGIWRILRSVRPSVTNMSTPKMALLGGIAAWMARVPHRIYTLRGLRYETTRAGKRCLLMACERLACSSAHRIICISRSVKHTIERDRIAPSRKTMLLGDRVSEGVSLRETTTIPQIAASLSHGVPVIGFVGRLTRDKGIRELVECFRLLRAAGVPAQLLLIGPLETEDPVDAAIVQYICNDPAVRWLGPVPDATPFYKLMDVFLFPTYREGLGRVLLEAAAAGKPVVSTRTTGVVDVVIDGVTGILVPPGNAQALAEATRKLLEDPELARAMGERARRLVSEEFDNAIYLNRLNSVLCSEPAMR